jgi:ATP-binding cassette subfamily B protein
VSERGFNLSGGQRQRLCLRAACSRRAAARCCCSTSPPARSTPAPRRACSNASPQAFPDACVIASIHRLSLLERFDTVVLMEAGRVLDHGPRDAVLARQPLLQRMARRARARRSGRPEPGHAAAAHA